MFCILHLPSISSARILRLAPQCFSYMKITFVHDFLSHGYCQCIVVIIIIIRAFDKIFSLHSPSFELSLSLLCF